VSRYFDGTNQICCAKTGGCSELRGLRVRKLRGINEALCIQRRGHRQSATKCCCNLDTTLDYIIAIWTQCLTFPNVTEYFKKLIDNLCRG
jgi:hypothetical protein